MALSRRTFLKSIAAAAIGAGLITVPLVDKLTPVARAAAFTELDILFADMCVHISLANFWGGTPIGARHKYKARLKAIDLRKQMNKEGVKLLT